jgi:uncharacterized membrane protein
MKDQDSNIKKSYSYLICHRMPDRTFKIGNTYFPVCSRCTGAYIGMFSYFIFVYFVYVQYTLPIILMGIIMTIPMALDGITQFLSLRESNNRLRFFTGLIGGIGFGILVKTLKWVLLS